MFGDRTAEMQGRLTLNPIKHIDPVGTVLVPAIMLLLPGNFVFGWAKPVPVDSRNMRSPRGNMVWVSAAGPAANLVMAIVWAFLMMLSQNLDFGVAGQWIGFMAATGIVINILLAVLNLVSSIGAFGFGLSQLLFLYFVVKCIRSGAPAGARPWEGADTLEWTHLPSPAPYHSFETPPVVK
jgi:hypothetical protein